jgi:hypothetical protein
MPNGGLFADPIYAALKKRTGQAWTASKGTSIIWPILRTALNHGSYADCNSCSVGLYSVLAGSRTATKHKSSLFCDSFYRFLLFFQMRE